MPRIINPKNEADSALSPDELRVLSYWRSGDNMTESYRKVMLSKHDAKTLSDAALKKRVTRFFGTYRMREAMAATDGERGERAKADFERWKCTQKASAIERVTKSDVSKNQDQNKPCADPSNRDVDSKSSRERWLESLQISDDPTAMSIYGTGLFLAQMAISQIMKRKKEIEKNAISPFEKNGCPYTSQDISALKTAAAMILPFAPPPTTAERRAMSMAGILVGLTEDSIREDPDEYTAPPPSTVIEVEKDNE